MVCLAVTLFGEVPTAAERLPAVDKRLAEAGLRGTACMARRPGDKERDAGIRPTMAAMLSGML